MSRRLTAEVAEDAERIMSNVITAVYAYLGTLCEPSEFTPVLEIILQSVNSVRSVSLW